MTGPPAAERDGRVAVVTVAAGRHLHLAGQQRSLAAGTRLADLRVVVSMGDPALPEVLAAAGPAARDQRVVLLDVPAGAELPLARARNRGAEAALDSGADLLMFLDVDCLAGRRLVERYAVAAATLGGPGGPTGRTGGRPRLLSGPVAYLPPRPDPARDYPEELLAATAPHPARPAPRDGGLVAADDVRLFWSLSFAVTAADWRLLGGFDEDYQGYGAEDTDLGQRAASLGGRMWWVGGATACHQWHPVSDPPVEHLVAVVRNANRFRRKWGWFPMEGWLSGFAERGLAAPASDGRMWRVLDPASTAAADPPGASG